MKRFLVFAGSDYYPARGMDDFQGDFDSIEEILNNVSWQKNTIGKYTFDDILILYGKRFNDPSGNWLQIYDAEIKSVIISQDSNNHLIDH